MEEKKSKKRAEEEDEDKDQDEEEDISADVRKELEESFLNIKERKFEIQPHVINADYCLKRLSRGEADDFDEDRVYAEDSEYMIYSEK